MADTTDTATVALAASDQISAPVLKAIASLQQLQAAIGDISKASKSMTDSSAVGVSGIRGLGEASDHSVAPHRAAHQALGLVTGAMGDLAGASPAAQAGVKVLDSIMFQMAVTGGALSLGFVGVVAAAAAVGSAFKSAADEAKKQQESIDKTTESVIRATEALHTLDAAHKTVAGAGLGQLRASLASLKQQLAEVEEQSKRAAESASKGTSGGFLADMATGMKAAVTFGSAYNDMLDKANASQVKFMTQARALAQAVKDTQTQIDGLTKKIGVYHSTITTGVNPLREFGAAQERAAADTAALGSALNAFGSSADADLSAVIAKAKELADILGITVVEAASKMGQILQAQTAAIMQGFIEASKIIGTAIGNAMGGVKQTWREVAKSLIGMVFDVATQVVIAAALMNEALTAAFIPGSFVAILGMVAVIQALKAGAMAALSSGASSAASSAVGSSAGSSSAGGSAASSGTGGTSGTAVGSANQNVVNNISVHLPIQTLDVSSVSDIQLRNLATRIGRVLSQAAGQGQFSLVGA